MTNRLIDKIRKLIRHEHSARNIGSIAEAERFAEKIQELCIEHKISVAGIELDSEINPSQRIGQEDVPTGRRLRYAHNARVPVEDNRLMLVVAEAHFCKALLVPNSNVMIVMGAEDDRAITVAMFRFLVRTMKRLARIEEERCRKARRSTRRFKPHFYIGFTAAVHRRYKEIRRKAESQSTALVLARTDQLVERYLRDNFETEPVENRKQERINTTAYFAGIMHGGRVDLGTNVMEGVS